MVVAFALTSASLPAAAARHVPCQADCPMCKDVSVAPCASCAVQVLPAIVANSDADAQPGKAQWPRVEAPVTLGIDVRPPKPPPRFQPA